MKRLFAIDWSLIPAFVLTAGTGIELHHAGHFCPHQVWHNWAVAHVVTSTLMLILTGWHIAQHWGWYKGLFRSGLGQKSRITAALSLVFLVLTATGLVLLLNLCCRGAHIGLWHFGVGLASIVLAALHIALRFRVLWKTVR